MRPQRNKQFDWSKPFKLIQDKKAFDQFDTGEDLIISIQNKQSVAQGPAYKKQNIITPRIQTVQRVTSVKPFAKINPNYIRLPQRLNLPKLIDYQLTQVDNVFVKTHSQRYKFKGKVILTPEFLSKTFIQLELKAGKDPVIPRNKGWMVSYLERQYKDLLDWENFQNFASLIYNFWKNRRQQLKFPLLRPLWRPNPEQFNHLLAFKPRQKQKRNLRKTTRISEDQILAQLHDQFQIAKQITQRVETRQQLRLKHLQSQLGIFHNQCKSLFGMPDFLGELNLQNRIKDKQKLKQLHYKLDKLKTKRQEPIQIESIIPVNHQQQPQQQIYDQRYSIACFLATVASQAEHFGINYSTIFESKPQTYEVAQPVSLVIPLNLQPKINQPFINMNLYKQDDWIIRRFQPIQDESSEESISEQSILAPKRSYEDLIDYYKSRISTHYIGEDDQFDSKDLRKNIATSFKKFQTQLKQI